MADEPLVTEPIDPHKPKHEPAQTEDASDPPNPPEGSGNAKTA